MAFKALREKVEGIVSEVFTSKICQDIREHSGKIWSAAIGEIPGHFDGVDIITLRYGHEFPDGTSYEMIPDIGVVCRIDRANDSPQTIRFVMASIHKTILYDGEGGMLTDTVDIELLETVLNEELKKL